MNHLRTVLLLLTLGLSACGFHLRGSAPQDVEFAFKSLYLKTAAETPFVTGLRRALRGRGIGLAETATQADLVLEIVADQPGKHIRSLSASGRVREYELRYRVALRAYDAQGNDWLPVSDIRSTHLLAFDDEQLLAKEQEEAQLYKDMVNDAVEQALRRLSRAHPRK